MWDGARPSPGYSPKKLQGAIILGTGGDGSNGGTGTFFEGAMTKGNPPDATDDAIQAKDRRRGLRPLTSGRPRGLPSFRLRSSASPC
jgi:non-reducing end alpha-L-arabinofuranosidase